MVASKCDVVHSKGTPQVALSSAGQLVFGSCASRGHCVLSFVLALLTMSAKVFLMGLRRSQFVSGNDFLCMQQRSMFCPCVSFICFIPFLIK